MTDDLRKIVDDATPGPWTHAPMHVLHDAPVVRSAAGEFVARCATDPPVWELGQRDATFIATFDPLLVSALLDVVEAAEPACSAKVMGAAHYQEHGYCGECSRTWPCEVARLRAALDRLETEGAA